MLGDFRMLGDVFTWAAKLRDSVVGFGVRVFVHVVALVSAVVGTGGSAPFSRIGAVACMYIGLVCLAARGISRSFAWIFPVLCGLAQAAILGISGFPLYQALFWGGTQALLQRFLLKKGGMGSELAALLFILPLALGLLRTFSLSAPLALSFGAVAAAGGITGAMRRRIAERLRRLAKGRDHDPAETVLAAFRNSVESLLAKQNALPEPVRPAVRAIAASAASILSRMTDDPRDMEPGRRFLKRYLVAAHNVTDSHLRLAREPAVTAEMRTALDHSTEMLSRLETAFAKEHARLLANDVTDFSTDLKVLDSLIKIDGHDAPPGNDGHV